MKYFVIGAGSIGRRHYENLMTLGADVVIISYRSEELAPAIREIASCGERAAVVIATSTHIRVPLLLECARNGAALYIEKPVAFDKGDFDQIFGLPLEVQHRSVAGFMMRYHPLVRWLLSYRNTPFYRAHFEVAHDVRQWRAGWDFRSSYASNPRGGGVLLDLCHELDLAALICGPCRIDYVGCLADEAYKGVDLSTQVHCSSDLGSHLTVSMDYLSQNLLRKGTLHGLDGRIEYDLVTGTIQVTEGAKRSRYEFHEERNQMFLGLMSDFMALAEGRPAQSEFVPRIDLVKDICLKICDAWSRREFVATIQSGLGHE